jgi:hypothetical protein
MSLELLHTVVVAGETDYAKCATICRASSKVSSSDGPSGESLTVSPLLDVPASILFLYPWRITLELCISVSV